MLDANEKLRCGKLCGVITQILPNGSFVKCEPVWADIDDSHIVPKKYYRSLTDDFGQICEFYEIDIKSYGPKVYLPANHKQINDGKEHFVVFRESQCTSKTIAYRAIVNKVDTDYLQVFNIGILFPKTFIWKISKKPLSEEELLLLLNS